MALADQPIQAPRNRLLAALPRDVLAALWPRLEPFNLVQRQVLHAPGKPIASIYFPETGWISMLAYMEDGDAAEVGLIGREGFAGLPVLLGGDSDDLEAMVQAPGTALRMDATVSARNWTACPPSARSCSATPWSTTGRQRGRLPAMGGTRLTSVSPAGC